MPAQVHKQPKTMPPAEAEELAAADAERAPKTRESTETIDDIDELLAEIDAVLEEQSVLVNFRQKGGQ